MITLGIDTSSSYASIALLNGEQVILEHNFFSSSELSVTLIPKIDFLLKSAAINCNDIELIGVVTGPGKFTGIRVGLSMIKGLFFERKIKIVPIIANQACAQKLKGVSGIICSLIDAMRKEVYAGFYESVNDKIKVLREPELLKISELINLLKQFSCLHFIGTGSAKYKNEFLENGIKGYYWTERSFFCGVEAAIIAQSRLQQNDYLDNPAALKPFYIRLPDAEVKGND